MLSPFFSLGFQTTLLVVIGEYVCTKTLYSLLSKADTKSSRWDSTPPRLGVKNGERINIEVLVGVQLQIEVEGGEVERRL